MRLSFTALSLIGLFCFIALIVSVGKDFRSGNTLKEQVINLSNPGVSKLEITSVSPDQKFYRNRWFKLEPFTATDEDTMLVQNISIHIVKSPNDSFKVTMLRMANGKNRRSADTLASIINFNAIQNDSLLVIDKGIPVTRTDKFRNQRVVLTVYVPVGKQIRVNKNIGWGGNISFGFSDNNDWNIDFEDVEEGWDRDVDYVMKADGLYDLNGRPASYDKRRAIDEREESQNNNENSNGTDMTNDVYRYDQTQKVKEDSFKQKSQIDEMNQLKKDSIEKKVKEKLKEQEQKADKVAREQRSSNIAYSLPAYNPLLIMN